MSKVAEVDFSALLTPDSALSGGRSAFSTANGLELVELLAEIEMLFGLTPASLTDDKQLIRTLKETPTSPTELSRTKPEKLRLLVGTLSDLNMLDLTINNAERSDDFEAYKDKYDSLMHRLGPSFEAEEKLRLDLESVNSIHTRFYESDYDETASLMACDSNCTERSPSIFDISPDSLDEKFKLHKVLEDLKTRHLSISLSFQHIDSKLAVIKKQNGEDLEFLDKLMANNELIRDRMHDMRSELNELVSTVQSLKQEVQTESDSSSEPQNHSIIVIESDSETIHSISFEEKSIIEILDGDSIIELGMVTTEFKRTGNTVKTEKQEVETQVDTQNILQDVMAPSQDDSMSSIAEVTEITSEAITKQLTATETGFPHVAMIVVLAMAILIYRAYN